MSHIKSQEITAFYQEKFSPLNQNKWKKLSLALLTAQVGYASQDPGCCKQLVSEMNFYAEDYKICTQNVFDMDRIDSKSIQKQF